MRFGLVSAAIAAAVFSVDASAATYNFTLAGADFNGSGTITAGGPGEDNLYPCPTCVGGLGYLVDGITGTINGEAITGVAPLNSIAGNNNKIYEAAPFIDWGDLGFTTANHIFNVFNGDYSGTLGDFIAVDNQNIRAHPVTFALSAAAPVPEPGVFAMMAAGLAVVGGTARRRRARHG